MTMSAPLPRTLVHLSLIAGALLLTACGEEEQAQQPAAPPPPAVTVATVAKQDVTPSVTFNGRVAAVDQVELRARVEGFVEQSLFEAGADVKAGALLNVLEKDAVEAEHGQRRGEGAGATGTTTLGQ